MSDIGMILDRIGRKLVTEVAPKLEGDYSGGHAAMSGLMSVMAGEAWDGAADRLVNEIAGMRGLFALAGKEVAVPKSESFKVSDLSEERNALAGYLTALQMSLESREDEEAKELNAKIWMHLMATAMARMPSPPDFPDADE
ncbi:MAG: SAE2 C-terminal domain-containing protein [Henriciella sp.]